MAVSIDHYSEDAALEVQIPARAPHAVERGTTWWGVPHSVLLRNNDELVIEREPFNPDFAAIPSIMDIFIAAECVIMIAPGYFWFPGTLEQRMLNATLTIHDEDLKHVQFNAYSDQAEEYDKVVGRVSQPARGRHIPNKRAEKYVSHISWCAGELAHRQSVEVTVTHNDSYRVRTRVHREKSDVVCDIASDTGDSDSGSKSNIISSTNTHGSNEDAHDGDDGGGGGGVAACTMFVDFRSLVPWAHYMRAIGLRHIYAILNGNMTAAVEAAFNNSSKSSSSSNQGDHGDEVAQYVRAALELVQSSFLTLSEWDLPFNFYIPGGAAFGTTKRAAMSSCVRRHKGKHRWMVLTDDDEFVYVTGGRTLEQYLADRAAGGSGHCVLLAHTWAVAGLTGREELTLDKMLASDVRLSPAANLLGRTKYILGTAPPVYDQHFNQYCEPHG